jgi:putative transposase
MEKYRNKYRNDSTRLSNRDYGSNGSYFVTLITKNRKNYFGRVERYPAGTQNPASQLNVETQNFASPQIGEYHFALVHLTEIGKIAHQYWTEIPDHFPFVILDAFIIMPNHVHGILSFNKPDRSGKGPNAFGPQSKNLASVIRGYKAATKKYATLNSIEFSWQPRYHERIVRLDELRATRQYIKNNPVTYVRTQNLASQQDRRTQNLAPQQDRRTQNLASQHDIVNENK